MNSEKEKRTPLSVLIYGYDACGSPIADLLRELETYRNGDIILGVPKGSGLRMSPKKPDSGEGLKVKKLNLHDTYMLGKQLAPLLDLSDDAKVGPHLFQLWRAREALKEQLADNSPLLEAAKRAANQIIFAIGRIIPDDIDKALKLNDNTVGYQAYNLRDRIRDFESVLTNELPGVQAYLVSQKGIYKTEDLITHADRQFPPDFATEIPGQVKLDICEAGKCLAYEVCSACSFHLWRAVEGMMGAYYLALTNTTFEEAEVVSNWAEEIRALDKAGAKSEITIFLNHIRSQYRNPQTHPEVNVSLNEALALFGAAASSINQQVMAIREIRLSSTPIGNSLTGIDGLEHSAA